MEYFHLTTPQQNIWNLQKYYEDTAIANLCGTMLFQERKDGTILRKAICQFIRSQSGIRIRFREGDEPEQYVSEEVDETIPVMVFQSGEELDRYAETFAREPIGLTDRPMYRFVVFHLEKESRSGILVVLSHLISDAWTFGLMANQIDIAYRRLTGEKEFSLLKGEYVDFVRSEEQYLVSDRYEKDKKYWEEKYVVRPEATPVKLCQTSTDAAEAKRVTRSLPSSLEQNIAVYCKKYPVTQAVLFETALAVYLFRINPDIQTVTIGVPVLNRSGAKEKEIAGMFVSTMPLTVSVTEDMEIAELTRQITKGHMDLFRHQKYPYADILRSLREKQDFSGNLYDAMISYQNAKTKTGADTKWYSNGYSEVPLVIHIDNRDENNCHTINVDYQTAVFRNEEEIDYLIERLEYILEQIVEEGAKLVGDIGIVPQREYDKIVYEFNDTYVDYPKEKCVHELFMEQAAKMPERIALVFEDKKFTYRQLDVMSDSFAYFLREKGVMHGDRVAVFLKRDERVIIAQLAVLKLGAVFIPIDSRYPKDRVEYILTESSAKILLKNKDNNMVFPFECCVEEWNCEPVKNFDSVHASPDEPCYAIFTSGSTGRPKGCLLTQKGLVNFCINVNILEYCNCLKDKICISVNTISFDMFILESLFPLSNGYTVVIANEEQSVNREAFKTLLCDSHANIIQTTPTRYKIFFDETQDSSYARQLDIIVSSGEALPLELLQSFLENTDAKIFNPMGPSECTIYVVGGEMSSIKKTARQADITLGKPIANTQIYILDKANNLLPIGVAGELCIAGDGVGKGYMNRPELTADRFVPNPFASTENHHGKIMYRTGDLARWRWDGEIEYLGRIDTQVKIRGLRIELGEIESVMAGFPGTGLVAVADRKDEKGRQYLVGYYTSAGELDERQLRAHLSAKLPKYMVPNYFMRLEDMPMTASGKTDRKNLPAPDFTVREQEYVAPVTDTEERLALIWRKLLSVEKAGRTDDFFELGGDSLLAISALNEIEKEFHVEVSVKDIMEQSSLEQLALCIDRAKSIGDNLTACHEKKYVLLPQQKAIYAACQKEPDSLIYNMPAKIALPQNIDKDKLRQSICKVLEHHKILKSYIRVEDDEIYGIYDENAKVQFEEYRDGEEEKFVRAFDLGKAPLVHIGFTEDAMLFDMHHIIADGSSLNIILRDIVATYEGRALCQSEQWFADYARRFYGSDLKKHKAYFKEMLKCEFEPVTLPETQKAGQGGESKTYFLSKEIFEQVKKFARANGLTETMAFLGAYGILLSKYTAKKDVLSSVILQNRTHADTKDMVGMFVNTLPVYLAVSGDMLEYMGMVKEAVLNLLQYQELPFWDIANAVGMEDKAVVNTSFVYQGDGEKKLALDGQSLIPQFIDTHASKFDLSMELTPLDAGCRIRMEYNLVKYDGQLMDELAEAYIRILEQLYRKKIADVSALSDEEYYKIVDEFNDTYMDYPREKCVHELFTEQVQRTPDRIALVFEDKKFTYRQLDEMSNSLALFMSEKGVKYGSKVAVLLKRDERVIITQLAVFKLGAVFIPIDSRYPLKRVEYILLESNADILIKNRDNNMNFSIECDIEEWKPMQTRRRRLQLAKVSIDEACYVIFTSGSTGQPKGCMLTNRGIMNFCRNNNILKKCGQLSEQIFASVNTISFDYFIAESLLPLLNGYTIVLANEEESMSQEPFTKMVVRNRVNVIQTTPTRYKLFFDAQGDLLYARQFKVIVTSGETLPLDLLKCFAENTKAAIFNPLGPSECSVWATGGELCLNKESITAKDITIGKPIANTQIYILDKDNNPLPIGVPGELCIAGDGVGKGYLNRPELTAERFVPNPFARPDNHHGKTMYHTGDLARWRRDGEIEYLGRIDTQVKIRGLRIELGEIESVMGSFTGIGLCAVADKRDETGRQYLVGYYTTDSEIDERELRRHLSAKLPKYMVPNYFMRLDVMPMTASGKTDRKNLPVPDFAQQSREYLAPVTERERELCRLMEELLHVERAGVTDDFFELGGDSLTAIEFLAKAHDRGIDFALQNIFDYPTVRQLCDHMEKGSQAKVHYEPSDFDKYQSLFSENVIDEAFVPEKKSLGNVLLTGATGFLGAHVLDRLMQEETGKIYCLVRSGKDVQNSRNGKNVQNGKNARNENGVQDGKDVWNENGVRNGVNVDCCNRLRKILKYYFGERYEGEFTAEPDVESAEKAELESGRYHARRIIPIAGDIESETLAENMPKDVQTVIHTAASVKHYGSYDYFNRVNVEGTRHVVNYARSVGARLIHVSTLSVSGNSMADDFTVYRSEEEKFFDETSFYIGQPLDNVYIHSKFEAEMAVFDAMLEGMDGAVIRVGNLTSRASDYKFQPNYRENAFLTRVKAILEFGLFPDYLMYLYSEFSPIDLTAEGIVKIAQYAGRQSVFHLNSNRPIYFDRFLEVVHELGISMEVVDGSDFYQALQKTIKDSVTEYIFEAFQNDMDAQGRLVYDSNIHIINDFTVWFLKKTGFEWNETDMEYIRGYIEYFRGIGYLEV